MAERNGVDVFVSWVDEDDEAFLAEVDFMDLVEVPGAVHGLLTLNPDVIVDRVEGYLDLDQDRPIANIYRVVIHGTRGLTN